MRRKKPAGHDPAKRYYRDGHREIELKSYGPDDPKVVLHGWGAIGAAIVTGGLFLIISIVGACVGLHRYLAKPDASRLHSLVGGSLWFLVLIIGLPGFFVLLAVRFRVAIDETTLSYRYFFFTHRIRLADIERIDKDYHGVTRPPPANMRVFGMCLYVHPKPGSGARGFRIVFNPMQPYDSWVMYKKLEPYMPQQKPHRHHGEAAG